MQKKFLTLVASFALSCALAILFCITHSFANDVASDSNTENEVSAEYTEEKTHTHSPLITKAGFKATTTVSGITDEITCCDCGEIIQVQKKVYYPKTVTLSTTSRVYNGKVYHPTVKVKDSKGVLIPAKNYTVSYSAGCKDAGTYTLKVTFKGNYSGVIKKTFKVTKKPQEISAKNISLKNGTSKSLGAKKTVGNGALTYKSSNTSIATVSSKGTLKAKASGKVTITITAAETKNYKKTEKKIKLSVEPNVTIKNVFNTANTTAYKNRPIKYIVIHYTAGFSSVTGAASNIAFWYMNPGTKVSSDFVVDDTTVVQYNGDIKNRYTWHCGGSKYYTRGGSLYGIANNSNTISIEVCSTNTSGIMAYANSSVWKYSDAVVNNTLELTKYLMDKYNIDANHVIRHYDVTGKPCPGIIGWNIDSGSDQKWKDFKKNLKAYK